MRQAAKTRRSSWFHFQVQRPIVVVRVGKAADGFGRHFKRVAPFARARVVPAAVQWSGAVACIQPQLPAETQINDVFYTRLRQTFPFIALDQQLRMRTGVEEIDLVRQTVEYV